MSRNQDETREWSVLVRITEHPGLGDHPWWTQDALEKLVEDKLTTSATGPAIGVDEVIAVNGYHEIE